MKDILEKYEFSNYIYLNTSLRTIILTIFMLLVSYFPLPFLIFPDDEYYIALPTTFERIVITLLIVSLTLLVNILIDRPKLSSRNKLLAITILILIYAKGLPLVINTLRPANPIVTSKDFYWQWRFIHGFFVVVFSLIPSLIGYILNLLYNKIKSNKDNKLLFQLILISLLIFLVLFLLLYR